MDFDIEYKKLNPAQKEAVDTIEGPVMVVAGPGTGKTQILALRIGNILKKTDTKADGILCLTFTNSGVKAMRERLRRYIGSEALKVNINTFHSFGMEMIREYFRVLGKDEEPKLLDDKDAILLCDHILASNTWEYIRPRSDTSKHFKDLKSLISALKRERVTGEDLIIEIKTEIADLENDSENISSRGSRKGELKKEVEQKISGLMRTTEAVKFFELYEKEKESRNLLDYDDVLEKLIEIVEESDTARAEIKEKFLYVLVDEHQDSSGLQNEFLKAVWADTEKPNIFVVGDDRQLIYGFGGASLEYFEEFKHAFGKAKLITLIENYRSTQNILDTSHHLLQSSLVSAKLKSNIKENHNLSLMEADYERDEIIAFGLKAKELMSKKKDAFHAEDIALLVPKNRQVKSAVAILNDLGLEVATVENPDFFDSLYTGSFIRVLKILAEPSSGAPFGESLFDPLTHIDPIEAHKFLRSKDMRNFSFIDILGTDIQKTLFKKDDNISNWITNLEGWLREVNTSSLYSLVQKIGSEFLLAKAKNHEDLVERVEVVRSMLHLVLNYTEKDQKATLPGFCGFLDRISAYGEELPMATFDKERGVRVMTLHSSKGLEFDFVWIAHMDQRSLTSSRRGGFTLPESVKIKLDREDEEVHKRQLYVAITRAKRFCTISYARHSYTGANLELANIVIPLAEYFEKQTAEETETKILADDPKSYVSRQKKSDFKFDLNALTDLVKKEYENKKVSVSLLNNFFECPWKWYFRNLLQLPEEKSASLEFGNTVHTAIDTILKTGKLPEGSHYQILDADDQRKAEKIVEDWFGVRYKELAQNRKNEESISLVDDQFPHLNIYGKIDLIEILDEGIVRVTDFKTGAGRKGSEIEKMGEEDRMSDYMRQLAMYSYLLSHNRKWKKEVAESVLEFLEAKQESEKFYRTHISEEQIELLRKDIQDYDELLKSGTWVDRPCNFKSYGKQNAVCEYCKMAEIYKN